MAVVEVESVGKSFDEIRALKGIDISVKEGQIFGLIGPDGAGKTTLFRIIASILLPDTGSVKVCEFDTRHEYKKVRTLIGYMPGRFSLYHDLTVEENLNFYATVFGTTVKENYELIKDIYKQIEPFRKRRAGALSGGMKQKLALSCALIHKPELLILDEPTTGVDAVSRKEFWDMLNKISSEGITIIVSTPYMDEAMKCDRVALIQKGQILSKSKPREISSFFKSALYSFESHNSNYRMLTQVREKPWCKSAWLFGQEVHVGIKENNKLEELEKEFRKMKDLKQFKKIEPGIEDTFIDLMENI